MDDAEVFYSKATCMELKGQTAWSGDWTHAGLDLHVAMAKMVCRERAICSGQGDFRSAARPPEIALEVPQGRRSLRVSGTVNYERHWRLMLLFDEFDEPQHLYVQTRPAR